MHLEQDTHTPTELLGSSATASTPPSTFPISADEGGLSRRAQVEETFQDAMRAALNQVNGDGSSTGLSTSMASRLQPAAAAAPATKPAALSFTLPASLTAAASSAPAAAAPTTFTAAAATAPTPPLFPNLGAAPATTPAPSPFTFGGGISSAPALGAPPTTTTAAAAAPKALSFNLPSNTNPFAAGAGLSVAVPPPSAAAAGGEDGEEPPPSPTKVRASIFFLSPRYSLRLSPSPFAMMPGRLYLLCIHPHGSTRTVGEILTGSPVLFVLNRVLEAPPALAW